MASSMRSKVESGTSALTSPRRSRFGFATPHRFSKGNVDRYVFISTISVFSDTSQPGMDESGPLAKYEGADAMAETQATVRANMALYGQLKVESEKEAEKHFPNKTLIIRPGLIAGPRR